VSRADTTPGERGRLWADRLGTLGDLADAHQLVFADRLEEGHLLGGIHLLVADSRKAFGDRAVSFGQILGEGRCLLQIVGDLGEVGSCHRSALRPHRRIPPVAVAVAGACFDGIDEAGVSVRAHAVAGARVLHRMLPRVDGILEAGQDHLQA